jgi:Putative zinc-finger
MSCTLWNERLTERLYGEIAPEDDAALDAHLESCAPCRTTLEEFQRVRTLLSADEPAVPRTPRVVVLRDRSRVRPALLAASLLGAAVLAGAGAGLGFAVGRGIPQASPVIANQPPASADLSTEALVEREVDRRLAAWESAHGGASTSKPAAPATALSSDPPVGSAALQAELAKFERRMNGARSADIDYVLDQIAASEVRVFDRIGKTNQALRSVALASNPHVNEQ